MLDCQRDVMSQPAGFPTNTRRLPDEFEELDFEMVEEYWNEYELSDGCRIKARTILKKILADPNNPDQYTFDMLPMIAVVYAPVANRGPKNNEPRPDEYPNLPSYEIRISRSDEKFNLYRILKTGRLVRIKVTVTMIMRLTDRFDNDGLPFYLITSGPMVVVDPPTKKPGP